MALEGHPQKGAVSPPRSFYLPTSIPSVSLLDTKCRSGTVTDGEVNRDEDQCPVRLKIFDKRFTLIDPRLKILILDYSFSDEDLRGGTGVRGAVEQSL